jgi:hypothetical protein
LRGAVGSNAVTQANPRIEPNGGFHEASVDLRIRIHHPARCRNHVAFDFKGRPCCADPTGMASLKNSQATAGANKLPIEEYEDLLLVLSTPAKH